MGYAVQCLLALGVGVPTPASAVVQQPPAERKDPPSEPKTHLTSERRLERAVTQLEVTMQRVDRHLEILSTRTREHFSTLQDFRDTLFELKNVVQNVRVDMDRIDDARDKAQQIVETLGMHSLGEEKMRLDVEPDLMDVTTPPPPDMTVSGLRAAVQEAKRSDDATRVDACRDALACLDVDGTPLPSTTSHSLDVQRLRELFNRLKDRLMLTASSARDAQPSNTNEPRPLRTVPATGHANTLAQNRTTVKQELVSPPLAEGVQPVTRAELEAMREERRALREGGRSARAWTAFSVSQRNDLGRDAARTWQPDSLRLLFAL